MKKRRKFNIFKTIRTLIVIALLAYGLNSGLNYYKDYKITTALKLSNIRKEKLELRRKEIEQREYENNWKQVFKEEDKTYPVIKQDINPNYKGFGQQVVKNKNGYFTTFTTVEENKKIYIEYKQNGYSTWKDEPYWGETMEVAGCGITALSILLSGYGYTYTPEDLRNKYYPNLDYSKLSNELANNYNIDSTNFYFDRQYFDKNKIIEHLKTNRPIIICLWSEKENRWTTKSHYMLLLAATDDELVYVSNPNGLLNSSKSSGWYDIDELLPYLAKIMYINSY